jgi:hypothetical protein
MLVKWECLSDLKCDKKAVNLSAEDVLKEPKGSGAVHKKKELAKADLEDFDHVFDSIAQ